MFTQKEIVALKAHHHEAIIMAPKYGTAISQEEYDEVLGEFKLWATQKHEEIEKKYGKEAGQDFLGSFATAEVTTFLKAGYKLDYKYLNNLIKTSKVKENVSYFNQAIFYKLAPIRESFTVIALNSNAIWKLKSEKMSKKDYDTAMGQMTYHTENALKLLAIGESGSLAFLSDMTKIMREDNNGKDPEIRHYIKALRSASETVNGKIYTKIKTGFIETPIP